MMTTPDHSRGDVTTAAAVTFVALGLFGATILGVFVLIVLHLTIEPVMLGVLGTLMGTLTTIVSGAAGYWVGGSSGGKTANAALAQIAGAGPPPPASPLASEPKPDLPSPAGDDFAIPAKP